MKDQLDRSLQMPEARPERQPPALRRGMGNKVPGCLLLERRTLSAGVGPRRGSQTAAGVRGERVVLGPAAARICPSSCLDSRRSVFCEVLASPREGVSRGSSMSAASRCSRSACAGSCSWPEYWPQSE